jgi:hypothetical protein
MKQVKLKKKKVQRKFFNLLVDSCVKASCMDGLDACVHVRVCV